MTDQVPPAAPPAPALTAPVVVPPLPPPVPQAAPPAPPPTVSPVVQEIIPPAVASAPPTPASAVRDIGCTLLDVGSDAVNRTVVAGVAGAGAPEAAARAALAPPGGRAPALEWHAARFDGPYCGVLDTLRGIRNAQPPAAPGFELALRGNRPRLRDGEIIAPLITAPAFPAHLQLMYLQSDRTIVQLFPGAGAPDRTLQPGTAVPVGDPQSGGWPVGPPYGTDMMLAVMSSAPLPDRSATDSQDAYLAALRDDAAKLVQAGGTVLVRVIPIQTTK